MKNHRNQTDHSPGFPVPSAAVVDFFDVRSVSEDGLKVSGYVVDLYQNGNVLYTLYDGMRTFHSEEQAYAVALSRGYKRA